MMIVLHCITGVSIADDTTQLLILHGNFHLHKAKVTAIKPCSRFLFF